MRWATHEWSRPRTRDSCRETEYGSVPRFFWDSRAAYEREPSWRGYCTQGIRMKDMNQTFVEEAPGADHSFEWLEAHADYLFNLAVGQVRDETAAEDLVQETFLAALKARNSFRGQSSDRTWGFESKTSPRPKPISHKPKRHWPPPPFRRRTPF